MLPFSEKTALVIAIVSTLLASVADVLLLYDASANYIDGQFLFMKDISHWRLLVGQYLGLLSIPLYVFGFYYIYKRYEKKSPRLGKLLFWVSTFLLFPSVCYHIYCSAVAIKVKDFFASGSPPELWDKNLDGLRIFFEPMAVIFVIGYVLFSVILFWSIWKNKSDLNPRKAFFNPLFFYVFCILMHLVWPLVGNALLVAGFNLSLCYLFVGLWVE